MFSSLFYTDVSDVIPVCLRLAINAALSRRYVDISLRRLFRLIIHVSLKRADVPHLGRRRLLTHASISLPKTWH